jgi:hypothetical protein
MRLDAAALLSALFLPSLAWLIAVIGSLVAGQPGVVCITPFAWILALAVGRNVALWSRGPRPDLEAPLAGALLGLGQGALFIVVAVLFMELKPGEAGRAALLSAALAVAGAAACALLAWVAARHLLAQMAAEREAPE